MPRRQILLSLAVFLPVVALADEKAPPAAAAAPAPDAIGIEWVAIPGGSFQMGSDKGSSYEQPVHTVRVSSFELMKTEVTVGQYRACMEAGACTAPDDKSVNKLCNWGHPDRDDHPISCVGVRS